MIEQFIDIVIVLLLVVAIGFGLILDRRVRRLTAALRELKPAVDDFSIAVDRSEDTISAFRAGAQPRGTAPAKAEESWKSELPFGLPSFRSRRSEPETGPQIGASQVEGKSDLVRNFFETARSRQA